MFQLTRPHGARRYKAAYDIGDDRFNSRARTGRDFVSNILRTLLYVSTHAPARGATASRLPHDKAMLVSTHAPARGATSV